MQIELTLVQKIIALNWLTKHKEHVSKIIEQDTEEYAPSEEDISKPELWKPAHWRWFLNYIEKK